MINLVKNAALAGVLAFGSWSYVDRTYDMVGYQNIFGGVCYLPQQKAPDYDAICARNPQLTREQCIAIIDQFHSIGGH